MQQEKRRRRIQVVFRGSKAFPLMQYYADVWIVYHRDLRTIEIIAYEPLLGKESQRIYLDTSVLKQKIDRAAIESKLRQASLGEVFDDSSFASSNTVISSAIADYVFPRLAADDFLAADNTFALRWAFRPGDFDGSNHSPLIVHQPATLTPYCPNRNKGSLVALVTGLLWSGPKASARIKILARWRMPLVLLKVARWRRLREGDTLIMQRILANLTSPEAREHVQAMLVLLQPPIASPPLVHVTSGTSNAAPNVGLARESSGQHTSPRTRVLGDFERAKPPGTRSSANLRSSLLRRENVSKKEEGNPLSFVASTFSALGASIKASFSSKKVRSVAVVPVAEDAQSLTHTDCGQTVTASCSSVEHEMPCVVSLEPVMMTPSLSGLAAQDA